MKETLLLPLKMHGEIFVVFVCVFPIFYFKWAKF